MTELMIKMTFWLIAAMLLGFIVAWFLSRTIYKKRQSYIEDTFSAVILERNNMVEKLEKSFRNKRIMFKKLSEDLTKSEEALSDKTSLLTTLQNRVDNSSSHENTSLVLKEKNNLLFKQIQKLEQSDIKRVKELDDFGEIVLLAEEKVEETEKNYKQIVKKLDNDIERLTVENEKHENNMKAYQKTISNFEESLKLYEANSSETEFIISKDQFVQIEEQLIIYQKEIKSLKYANKKLLLNVQTEERSLADKT
jgi:chromosome segregation ATPase